MRKALEMAGADVSGVECGGAINQSDPVTPDPGDTDTADTDSPVDPADTGDTVNPDCGNGVVDANEVCDGNTIPCSNLAGAPQNGEAKCASNCMSWDKSGCYDGDEPQADNKDDATDNNGSKSADLDDEDDSGCSVLII